MSPLSGMTLAATRGLHTFLAESRLLDEDVFFTGAAAFLAGAFLVSVFLAGAAFAFVVVDLAVVAFLAGAALAGLVAFSFTTFSFFSFFSLGAAAAFLAAFGFSLSALVAEAFAFAGFDSGLFCESHELIRHD